MISPLSTAFSIRPQSMAVAARLASAASNLLCPTTTTHLLFAPQVRHIRLNKQAREHVDNNPDLRSIVDEFSVPGKYHKFLFPSKRQQKRDAKVAEPPAPEPWVSPSSSLLSSVSASGDLSGAEKSRVSKKMAQRVSRAIHDILYDPHFGVSAETGEAPSWRVDKIDVAGSGKVTVWWIPVDDVQSAMLMDNEYMVEELNGMAQLVKRALQSRLKLRKSEVPKIVFMRRDTSLELLLDIVEEELVISNERVDILATDTIEPNGSDVSGAVEADPKHSRLVTEARGQIQGEPQIDLFKRL